MEQLIIFSKTHYRDIHRFEVLYGSILKHNKDNIPFYASVPSRELKVFKAKFPECNIIADEDIVESNESNGWVHQQLVKTSVYKLSLCHFYVCIDSDSYFIKDFYKSDFLLDHPDGPVPFLVMHENKNLFEITSALGEKVLGYDPKDSFLEDNEYIMDFFGREGKVYDFGPTPCIWSTEVWYNLNFKYGIENLLKKRPTEIKWYGEYVLRYKYPYRPIEPLFRCFHYKFEYDIMKQLIPEEEQMSKNYLGVVMQSNWNAPLKY